MKVLVIHGTEDRVTIELAEGSTVETALKHPITVTVCGDQGAARVNTTEVPVNTPLKDGDTVEPVTVANEKA